MMDSFVLVAFASLAVSRTLLQQLPVCRNFTLDTKDLFCWYKQKRDFHELWQQNKQLQTMEMSEVSLDTYDEMKDIYVNSKVNPPTKFTSSTRRTEFKDICAWNIYQMTPKTVPISMRKIISYVMKQGIPFPVCWKVNENWDNIMIRTSIWWESHYRTNTSIRRNKYIQKSRTVRATVRKPSRNFNHMSKVI